MLWNNHKCLYLTMNTFQYLWFYVTWHGNLYFVTAICKSLNLPPLSPRLPMNTFGATTTLRKWEIWSIEEYLPCFQIPHISCVINSLPPQSLENWAVHCSHEFICQSWQLSNGVIEGRDRVMYRDNKLVTTRDTLCGAIHGLFFRSVFVLFNEI